MQQGISSVRLLDHSYDAHPCCTHASLMQHILPLGPATVRRPAHSLTSITALAMAGVMSTARW
jgi:hypothetical protein